MRRPISRGELGSRRLVMLIFAGYPGRAGAGPGSCRILLIHRELLNCNVPEALASGRWCGSAAPPKRGSSPRVKMNCKHTLLFNPVLVPSPRARSHKCLDGLF